MGARDSRGRFVAGSGSKRNSVTVTDRGWGNLQKLFASLGSQRPTVKVGIFGGQEPTGIGTVQLATIHEFGAPAANIPERSFLRSTMDRGKPEYLETMKKLLGLVIDGRATVHDVLELLGQRISADVKKYIATGPGVPPPLRPATIRRKGSDRPLVDTGRMLASITYEVDAGEDSG